MSLTYWPEGSVVCLGSFCAAVLWWGVSYSLEVIFRGL